MEVLGIWGGGTKKDSNSAIFSHGVGGQMVDEEVKLRQLNHNIMSTNKKVGS